MPIGICEGEGGGLWLCLGMEMRGLRQSCKPYLLPPIRAMVRSTISAWGCAVASEGEQDRNIVFIAHSGVIPTSFPFMHPPSTFPLL